MFTFNKKSKSTQKPGQATLASQVGSDPFVDWSIILSVAVLVAVCFICVGGYMYIDTQNRLSGNGSASVASKSLANFDSAKLKSVIGLFDGRATEKVMLLRAYSGPKDPSLP